MSKRTTPPDWPKHCTAHDPDAPISFDRKSWRHYSGMNEGDETVIFEHNATGMRFVVCTKPGDAGWMLGTICQNPPKRRAPMHVYAQEAMRLYLEILGTTAELEAAETEAELQRMVGRIH